MSTFIGNLFSAGASVFGIIGFLYVWKQISSVREADKRKRNFYAANPTASTYPPARRDYEAEYYAMRERAESAEWAAEVATCEAEEAKGRALYAEESAAEEAAIVAEETREAAEKAERYAAEEAGEALADAEDEAERHWAAGLNEGERMAAWAERWQGVDNKAVREVIEKRSRWWAEIRARRKQRAGTTTEVDPSL